MKNIKEDIINQDKNVERQLEKRSYSSPSITEIGKLKHKTKGEKTEAWADGTDTWSEPAS